MVSTLRLYLLRAAYFLISLFLVTQIWPGVIQHGTVTHMAGVARCLLAAMAPFFLLGLRYPVKMIPILLFELTWKAIWLVAFGLPLRAAHQLDADSSGTFKACALGVVLCVLVIPWGYVFRTYLKAPGEGWKRRTLL